ncbi:DoxX family protein [Crenalkalicoccus roseus]|uniref:DoxX family protein n=1 Tax=Crenalkalicoccus roseus TaxID=1485588 RepID=UPI00108225EC|nr:DoxX family protein [Crenalkalicoccus roseus]
MFDEKATTPYAAALLRVALGVLFLAHGGLLKLGTFGLAGTMQFFGSIGYPPLLGAAVAFAEILGGLALIAGLWVRWVSLALVPVLLGATLQHLPVPVLLGATLQHLPAGWLFSAPGGGWEFPAFWTVALLVQAGLGAGAWALYPARPAGAGPRAAAA